MSNKKKIKRAINIYPFYEAVAGDLVFFSVIQTLFLMQVKGFSAAQIATIVFITDVMDLATGYPSYRIIRRLGNSISCKVGGIMPLAGIILITLGRSIPVVSVGMILSICSFNFQSMAGAAARNNLVISGEKVEYSELFIRSNTIYSVTSMVAAVIVPILYAINRYLPSILCILTFVGITIISFIISDYSEQGGVLTSEEDKKISSVKLGKGLRLILIIFCLFFCSGAIFTSNSEVLLNIHLEDIVSEQRIVIIYGLIMWAARVLRLITNILLPSIIKRVKDNIVQIGAIMMFLAFLSIGLGGLFFKGTILSVIIIGINYLIIMGVLWDPVRTFLRTTAVDTNSRGTQKKMVFYLNIGQSVVSICMDLIVVAILKVISLEYVFLIFAVISVATIICAVMLRVEFKKSTEIMHYESVLNEKEIDKISDMVFDRLKEEGMENRMAMSYRLLTENKLVEMLSEGGKDDRLCVVISIKLEEYHVNLKVGDEDRDIFTLPQDNDTFSQIFYRNITRNLE